MSTLDQGQRRYAPTFASFVSLVEEISQIQPQPAARRDAGPQSTKARVTRVVQEWVNRLERPLLPRTGAIFFRLLFPEEDVRRRYDLQENRLGTQLASILNGNTTQANRLRNWASVDRVASIGCLGDEVRRILNKRTLQTSMETLSLAFVDGLLDELAQHSEFSAVPRSPSRPRPKKDILSDLFKHLTPFGAACMTQIILKDLRPILYPLPSTRTSHNLLLYKCNSIHELNIYETMEIWDTRMPEIFKVRATLDAAAAAIECMVAGQPRRRLMVPEVGTPIEIPKCLKGDGCQRVINILAGEGSSPRVWAETKYDGERMQIHVDLDLPEGNQIRIISKTKRDSTLDRIATHSIIQAAMSLPITENSDLLMSRIGSSRNPLERIRKSVVLEAEMVCYNEAETRIDEFWRIRSLIDSTADGARSRFNKRRLNEMNSDTSSGNIHLDSLQSNASDNGNRHFKLVFFDLLFMDGESLVNHTYEARRAKLEHIVRIIPGFSMLAQRVEIPLQRGDPIAHLGKVFARHVADFEEGLVLKPGLSTYNELHPASRWIKLKKDYIPGLGDTLDLVVVGASWEKDRGRELRVGPETFTTFYVGAVDRDTENHAGTRKRVHIEVLFSSGYGLTREQLDSFNWEIRQSKTRPFNPMAVQDLSYSVSLAKGIEGKPTVMFAEPRLVELMGAGFSKAPGSKHYELRFPRITKIWNSRERSWLNGVDLREFHNVACRSVGQDPPQKRSSDVMKQVWEIPVSPGVRSLLKREDRYQHWLTRLTSNDNPRLGRKRMESPPDTPSSAPPAKRSRLGRTGPGVLGSSSNLSPSSTPSQSPAKQVSTSSPARRPTPTRGRENRPTSQCNPKTIPPTITASEAKIASRPPPVAGIKLHRLLPAASLLTPLPSPHHPLPVQPLSTTAKRTAEVMVAADITMRPSSPESVGNVTSDHCDSLPAPQLVRKPSRPVLRRSRTSLPGKITPSLDELYTLSRTCALPEVKQAERSNYFTKVPMPAAGSAVPQDASHSLVGALFFIQAPSSTGTVSLPPSFKHGGQRLCTIEALLCGLGWTSKTMARSPPPFYLTRGLVFVDGEDQSFLRDFISRLEELESTLRRSSEGLEHNPLPLSVYRLAHLPYFYNGYLSLTDGPVKPLWSSFLI